MGRIIYFHILSSVQNQWRQTGKSSEAKGSRGDQGMRSFHNRKQRVFSPLVFLIILPCSSKAMIVPCKHLARHKCQCWNAILIQEFVSLCVCRSHNDCAAWEQARPSHREQHMCSSWRHSTAYGKTKFLFQKQSWMMFNLAGEPCSWYDFYWREWITSGISCWTWGRDCSHEIQHFSPARHGFHMSWGAGEIW